MSLRAFHIVFVIVTVALSLFVAVWGFREFSRERDMAALGLAIVFLGTAAVLVVYGKNVYRKLKELP
jgi:Cu/Ag efflux pump CusA